MNTVTAVLVAFCLALVLTPLVRRLALAIGAVDRPNGRKVHQQVMPRLGGLAIYLTFVLTVVLSQPIKGPIVGLLIGATIIVVVGIFDDTRDLPPKIKLLGQVLAALSVIPFGVQVSFVTNPLPGTSDIIQLGWFGIPLTLFWIVGVTNAVNLIDGLDGLAAGVSAIASLTLAVVAWLGGHQLVVYCALILAAATVGFLKYNFHPAKLFMGDTGAMFLGFTLATTSIMGLTKGAAIISVFIPFLIIGIPILDTFFAILRRYKKGQPIFEADKDHLHHRLLAMGYSHPQTVLIIYGVNLFLGATAVLLSSVSSAQSMFILIAVSTLILVLANRIGILGQRAQVRPSTPQIIENVAERKSENVHL